MVRTKPFSFFYLVKRLSGIAAAGALLYWIGKDRFESWADGGVIGISWFGGGLVVLGVTVLCWMTTQTWKYFDPYPDMRITPGAAPLGSSFDVEWSFRGSKGRLREIAMALEGREEVWAENKAGKQAQPQKLIAPFYLEKLDLPGRLDQGQAHVQLPEGLMPTFDGEKARIVWVLRFENQIKWGARMKYEFQLEVLPEVSNG